MKKENNLFKKFAEVNWILHQYHKLNHHNSNYVRETYTKNRIFTVLKLQKEIEKSDLVFILGIPQPHFDKIIEKMKKEENIIFIEKDEKIFIKLTEKGEKLEIKNENDEMESIFDCLSEQDKEILNSSLDILISSLKNKIPERDYECIGEFHKEHFHNNAEKAHFYENIKKHMGRHNFSNHNADFFRQPHFDQGRNFEIRNRGYHNNNFDRNRELKKFFELFHSMNSSDHDNYRGHNHSHSDNFNHFREFPEYQRDDFRSFFESIMKK